MDGTGRLDNSNARRYCGSNQIVTNTSAFNSITVGAYDNFTMFLTPFDSFSKVIQFIVDVMCNICVFTQFRIHGITF